MTDELCLLPLEDVARMIEARDVSPVDVTKAVLARIERLNPQLNAYMTITAANALQAAVAAEREIVDGAYRGPLHGVPVAVKDLYATKGVRTTAGSKILTDWVPDHDAAVVEKLRGAGAIVIGKLGMHEWAFGTTSANVHFGPIRNPWDTARIPGGSSGGSGAATAAGLAFATLGSDTGGSIRIPAALCGVVGLMPTFGRVSMHGAVPLSWSLDHAGPLTRTVRDAAIVTQAIAGHDPRDPETVDEPVPDWLTGIERDVSALRIGVPKQYFWDKLPADVEKPVRDAIDALRAAGAQVRDVDWSQAAEYTAHCATVMLAEAAAYHARNMAERRDDYGDQVAALLNAGAQFNATDYVDAFRAMQRARRGEADAALDGVDVLITPTVPHAAQTIEEATANAADAARTTFTRLVDLTGQPAISVPCGVNSENLPVGLQIIGRRWDEASVLWAARAYELARGPFPAPPLT
jgi:aspartyl-tRNA(Asn)/glutamyl-tRNA(Gln) amidotransferase subunit A